MIVAPSAPLKPGPNPTIITNLSAEWDRLGSIGQNKYVATYATHWRLTMMIAALNSTQIGNALQVNPKAATPGLSAVNQARFVAAMTYEAFTAYYKALRAENRKAFLQSTNANDNNGALLAQAMLKLCSTAANAKPYVSEAYDYLNLAWQNGLLTNLQTLDPTGNTTKNLVANLSSTQIGNALR